MGGEENREEIEIRAGDDAEGTIFLTIPTLLSLFADDPNGNNNKSDDIEFAFDFHKNGILRMYLEKYHNLKSNKSDSSGTNSGGDNNDNDNASKTINDNNDDSTKDNNNYNARVLEDLLSPHPASASSSKCYNEAANYAEEEGEGEEGECVVRFAFEVSGKVQGVYMSNNNMRKYTREMVRNFI